MLKLGQPVFLLFPLIHFELTRLSPGYLLLLSHHVLWGSRWSRFISVIWWSGVTDGEFPCRASWGRWWASWGNTSATWRETSWTSTNQSSPPSSSPRWTSVLNTVRWVQSCSVLKAFLINMSDVFSSTFTSPSSCSSVKEWTDWLSQKLYHFWRSGRSGEDGGDRGLCDRLSARHGDETVGGHVQTALLQGNIRQLILSVTQWWDSDDVRWDPDVCFSCSCSTGVNLTVTSVCWPSTDCPTASPSVSKDSSSCSQETWWSRLLTCCDRPTSPRQVRTCSTIYFTGLFSLI